jgi:hypothetical protein
VEITKQQIEDALLAIHKRRNSNVGYDDPPVDFVIGFNRDWGSVSVVARFADGKTIVAPINCMEIDITKLPIINKRVIWPEMIRTLTNLMKKRLLDIKDPPYLLPPDSFLSDTIQEMLNYYESSKLPQVPGDSGNWGELDPGSPHKLINSRR